MNDQVETADVDSSKPQERIPWLIISSAAGVRALPLPRGARVALGRLSAADVVIEDESVSRLHAALHVGANGDMEVEDLGSRNKTRVSGRTLPKGERVSVAPGTAVQLGKALVVFQHGPAQTVEPRAPTPRSGSSRAHIVFGDETMEKLCATVETVAASPLNIMLFGETGTGKEVFADVVHRASERANMPLLRVNCAAFTGSLLEAELFGYEKGAFTGAASAKAGLFETADGGTVFLDEIGELPIESQAKLLRVIEYGEVYRLGSAVPRKVNVRYVTATNRNLDLLIRDGRFRQDLFFRLNGFSVTVPPLRDRPKDITPLAHHFLRKANPDGSVSFTAEAMVALERHLWPGNVRELKSAVERASVLARADASAPCITPEHLGLAIWSSQLARTSAAPGPFGTWPPSTSAAPSSLPEDGFELRPGRALLERDHIMKVLSQVGGNQTEAARVLGVSRRTLVSRLSAYGLTKTRRKRSE